MLAFELTIMNSQLKYLRQSIYLEHIVSLFVGGEKNK